MDAVLDGVTLAVLDGEALPVWVAAGLGTEPVVFVAVAAGLVISAVVGDAKTVDGDPSVEVCPAVAALVPAAAALVPAAADDAAEDDADDPACDEEEGAALIAAPVGDDRSARSAGRSR